ncbi:MAG TPA: hypothetical protein VNA17_04455 [Pyrinomonadaceae bacterium]|nr:hypothetical protein [Pyrinomonadaceae bacterium]
MDIVGFMMCLENEGYSASLERFKVYAVVPAAKNDPIDYLRIIDESGEDYLYPADWFETIILGTRIESRLVEAISA